MDPASRRNFGSSYYPKINVVRVSLPEENDSIWKPKKCQARHEETPFHQSPVTSLAKKSRLLKQAAPFSYSNIGHIGFCSFFLLLLRGSLGPSDFEAVTLVVDFMLLLLLYPFNFTALHCAKNSSNWFCVCLLFPGAPRRCCQLMKIHTVLLQTVASNILGRLGIFSYPLLYHLTFLRKGPFENMKRETTSLESIRLLLSSFRVV